MAAKYGVTKPHIFSAVVRKAGAATDGILLLALDGGSSSTISYFAPSRPLDYLFPAAGARLWCHLGRPVAHYRPCCRMQRRSAPPPDCPYNRLIQFLNDEEI